MASNRFLVHVVDDDSAVREALTLLLGLERIEVHTYASAEAFLEALPTGGCVVSDLHMPGLGGLGLLRTLRAQAPSLPVIIITAAANPELVKEMQALGAFRVIEKPFTPGEIIEAVRGALGR